MRVDRLPKGKRLNFLLSAEIFRYPEKVLYYSDETVEAEEIKFSMLVRKFFRKLYCIASFLKRKFSVAWERVHVSPLLKVKAPFRLTHYNSLLAKAENFEQVEASCFAVWYKVILV